MIDQLGGDPRVLEVLLNEGGVLLIDTLRAALRLHVRGEAQKKHERRGEGREEG